MGVGDGGSDISKILYMTQAGILTAASGCFTNGHKHSRVHSHFEFSLLHTILFLLFGHVHINQ